MIPYSKNRTSSNRTRLIPCMTSPNADILTKGWLINIVTNVTYCYISDRWQSERK